MKKEIRTAIYDEELRVEAYRLQGAARPFPNHFHEYYVIGLVEAGRRRLLCKNREYTVSEGDILLFDPLDSHACTQEDEGVLDYRGLNISKEVMLGLAEEVTKKRELPSFSENVIQDEEARCFLRSLHQQIMDGSSEFSKEELLLLLLSRLIQKCGQPFESAAPECSEEIERACAFIEEHYESRVSLDQICCHAGASKATLLRAFPKARGVTPYLYLQNIRIGKAKKLLEQGVPPAEAALRTGFSDQSHFTNYFTSFIGLSPGAYQEIFSQKEN